MITTELLKINASEFSLNNEKVEELKKPFIPIADEYISYIPKIEEIKKESLNGITLDLASKAKRVKLDIAKIRNKTKDIKDEEKKGVLQIGNAIQKCHNIIVGVIEEQESELEKIIKHFENLEKERLDKLQKEREELMKPYMQEVSDLIALCNTDKEKFDGFLLLRKTQFEEKIALEKKLEAERIEKERIEEAKRIELIKENARIEAEAKVMRDKIEAEMKAKADLERVEREKQEAIDKLKREQEKEKQIEIKRKQDEENARIEKEKQEKEKQIRLEKETKYKEFLEKNKGNFDKILKEDGKILLVKIIDTYDLN